MAFKAAKYELVELVVPGIAVTGQTGTRFNFPDLPKLRYVTTQALQFIPDSVLGTSPQNNANIEGGAGVANCMLVLYADERQDLWRIPIYTLNNFQNTNSTSIFNLWELKGQQIVWDKSYIEFTVAPGNTSNESLLLGVYYA